MKQEEYIKTIVVYNKMVKVGLDDYGQQYILEYVNDEGKIVIIGCGAYNFNYEDVAKSCIDYERYSQEIWGNETWKQMKREKEIRLKKYEERERLNDTNI